MKTRYSLQHHWLKGAALALTVGNTVALTWGPEFDVATAARELLIRAQDALVGVPSETRQMHGDCTTGLERLLPGPERMYPDTDTPPVKILDAWVDRIEHEVRECPWQRCGRCSPSPSA